MIQSKTDTYVRWATPAPRPVRAACYDLDDTLARYCKTRRLPLCAEFDPMPLLEDALKHQAEGTAVILASARPEWCYENTVAWCDRHGLRPTAIYLKNRYCSLPAHEMKMTMLNDIINHHQIISFYDDSMMTVLAAREMGVNAHWVQGNEIYWENKARAMGWDLPADWRAMLELV